MKKRYIILGIALFSSLVTNAQQIEDSLIRRAFEGYKSAILNDQEEEALKYIDSRTVKYYSEILDIVQNADSATVNSLSLIDKFTVLAIRHRATKEEIRSMKGSGVFLFAVKNGMVGKNTVVNNSIGEISLSGSFAKSQLLANGVAAPIYYHFYKENDQWKLNLTSLFPIGNTALKQMAEESGENENDFVFMILEGLTGKKPGLELWQKP